MDIKQVKIEKTRDGSGYIMRSEPMGKMAFAKTREVLSRIAERQGWAVVRAWR